MSIQIREIDNRSDLKRWVRFPYSLYAGHAYQVPQLLMDESSYFDRRRNPAFDVADVRLLLATDGAETLGRVCGSINPLEAAKLGYRRARFGWFECVDDQAVANALLDGVRDWAEKQQCAELTGPQGFSDLDPEGLLIEGFEQLPTISGSYNFPYYRSLLETYGLEKDSDYVEYRSEIPETFPLFERARKRYAQDDRYRVLNCKSRRELRPHLPAIWKLLEQAFEPLYGVTPLTQEQTDFYTRKYFSFLDPDFVKLAFSGEEELVGFFIAMPNLSHGFKQAGGHLLPAGFYHILRDYRRPETVDFLLAGVKPGEASGLISTLMAIAMYDSLHARGVRYMETNRELEENIRVNRVWTKFKNVYFRRSRVYRLGLN